MWSVEKPSSGITNKATVPEDGLISIVKPKGVKVSAFVNDMPAPMHHVHVKAGDTVHFELKSNTDVPTSVSLEYAGNKDLIHIAPADSKSKIEEYDMTGSEAINLFANPNQGAGMGGALGGGLGAGLVGGLLGTALFGRRGLGGEIDGGSPVATADLVQNTAIMQSLGDIKASVPLAEGQVQLALATAQADINNHLQTSTDSISNQLNTQSLANSSNFASLNTNLGTALASITNTVNTTASANLAATRDAALLVERNAWAVTQAVNADGDKTRALIQSIDKTNDSRTITSLAAEISDLKNSRNLDAVSGNITISNNNNANAIAQQQQAQQQQQQIATLLANVNALYAQNQHIQQGVLNIGSGVVAGNSQTAANTRVS